MSDHPEVPPSEWDGSHIDWETETCDICRSELRYVGDEYVGYVICKSSDETLFEY